jgi:RNA polymerase sigma-70 factor (ECF subfamily)
MTEEARPILSEYLTRHYSNLKQRVTRLLGNSDLAGDV